MREVLSPGIAYGCFKLLELIERRPMRLDVVKNFGKLGVVNASRVSSCVLALGWAEVNEMGELISTTRGTCIRELPLTELKLRQALLDLVEKTNPPWSQNARFGRGKFLRYAPTEIHQICIEARLKEDTDADTIQFWDKLAAQARGLHDIQLNKIGRDGERLTLQYEENRTKKIPKWIALDSNEYGYDILSQMSSQDSSSLCIEVKTSRQGLYGFFYLTRHEWDTAQILSNFQLHLWDISKEIRKLAIVDIDSIKKQLPVDQELGKWDVVSVPFSAFESNFFSVNDPSFTL